MPTGTPAVAGRPLDGRKRRSRGEGTIEERGHNVWRMRVYAGKDPVTGHPRQVSRTYHGSKTAALKEMRRLTSEVDQRLQVGTRATMATLFERWQEQLVSIGRSQVTVETYRGIVKTHLLPAFGDRHLDTLTAYEAAMELPIRPEVNPWSYVAPSSRYDLTS